MKIKFNVTQEDINSGIRNDCTRCPIAHALRRAHPLLEIPEPGDFSFYSADGKFYEARDWPSDVAKFILGFDEGKIVEPFESYIEFEEVDG